MPKITEVSPWFTHKRKWSKCKRCPLAKCRGKNGLVVLFRGALPCDLLFIGEAPGASENVLGKPFCGPAGKLLDDIITAAGYNVCDHDIPVVRYGFTNLVACIPLDDEGEKVSDPPPIAINACAPRLVEIVEIARPRHIITVGELADKWAPKVLQAYDLRYTKITHPAAILRANIASQGLMVQRCVVTLRDALEDLDGLSPFRKISALGTPPSGKPIGSRKIRGKP